LVERKKKKKKKKKNKQLVSSQSVYGSSQEIKGALEGRAGVLCGNTDAKGSEEKNGWRGCDHPASRSSYKIMTKKHEIHPSEGEGDEKILGGRGNPNVFVKIAKVECQ